MSAKYPAAPTRPLQHSPGDLVEHTGPVFRIARTSGDHVLPWNALRGFGWLPSMRWDPHPDRMREQPQHAVMYAATTVGTAAAEVWQDVRVIDTISGAPVLIGWTPARPLRLLDLSGDWLVRQGAARSLAHGPKEVCRAWARTIHDTWPDLHGLRVDSTMTGTNLVLFEPAARCVPAAPDLVRPLADPTVIALLAAIATEIGYDLLV